MRALPRLAIAAAAAVALCGTDARAASPPPVPVFEGQAGRALLGGSWHFRLDDARTGVAQGFHTARSLAGWQPVVLPHNWNGSDLTLNRSSVGWYRRDIRLRRRPRRPLRVVRFEGVNHYATVWLNGRKVAAHAGGYLPFEADLRLRKGRNRLVIRVSTMRGPNDLTHWRPARFNGRGTGGWWNFGGISREVTIRRVARVDIERVQAFPVRTCRPRCRARVEVRALVRNASRRRARVALTLRSAKRTIELPAVRMRGRSRREIVTRFTIEDPKLWGIHRGRLYGLRLTATAGRAKVAYRTRFGVRTIKRGAGGVVTLNGRRIRLNGVSVHEDLPKVGSAWTDAERADLLRRLDELKVTIVRSHYPLHPALLEALDRRGILVWSQAPVYQVQNPVLDNPAVRASAVAVNEAMVMRDRGHPSVLAWSIANELPDPIGPGHRQFITEAAAAIRRLDRSRLVAMDRVARLKGLDGDPALRTLDAIGVNEYFGWYRGIFAPDPPATTEDLATYLDVLHQVQPQAAIFVTEFGAEANRLGAVTEKGSVQFQEAYLRRHLEIQRARPWVNGSIVWILRDFRVHPTWGGGNPVPSPPYNMKGVVHADGTVKPGFLLLKREFRR